MTGGCAARLCIMRIIILSQYYAPEPIPKPHELAHGLRDRGHRVTVVTGFPNYPSGKLYPGYALRPWSVTTANGVRVVRLPLFPDHSASTRRRIVNYTSFGLSGALLGPWLCGAADVFVCLASASNHRASRVGHLPGPPGPVRLRGARPVAGDGGRCGYAEKRGPSCGCSSASSGSSTGVRP